MKNFNLNNKVMMILGTLTFTIGAAGCGPGGGGNPNPPPVLIQALEICGTVYDGAPQPAASSTRGDSGYFKISFVNSLGTPYDAENATDFTLDINGNLNPPYCVRFELGRASDYSDQVDINSPSLQFYDTTLAGTPSANAYQFDDKDSDLFLDAGSNEWVLRLYADFDLQNPNANTVHALSVAMFKIKAKAAISALKTYVPGMTVFDSKTKTQKTLIVDSTNKVQPGTKRSAQ